MNTPETAALSDAALVDSLDGEFISNHAEVNGVQLHYVTGGSGRPLILLGGWPQTWWQWNKVMPALARSYRVIAVDLRGMGGSSKPAGGYDKKNMAADIHELVQHLNLGPVSIAGHDIGAMVAYAFAVNYPEATEKVSLLDVAHPDAGWRDFSLLPAPEQHTDGDILAGNRTFLWWFAFNQVRTLPEQLLAGRFALLSNWLFDQSPDPTTIDAHSRAVYAHAYDTADAIRAGNAWYETFNVDIAESFDHTPITAPMQVMGGDASNYGHLADVMPGKGVDVRMVEIVDCGHYLPEEQPEAVTEALLTFLG